MSKYQIAFMIMFQYDEWNDDAAEEFGLFFYAHEGVDLEVAEDEDGNYTVINPNVKILESFIKQDQEAFEEEMNAIFLES